METQKQDAKKEIKKEGVAEYVKLSEMSKEDILALPVYRANLIKQKSRRGQVYYRLVIELHPLLKIEKRGGLSETEFNLICLERKLSFDLPIQGISVPVRLVRGKSESGKEWARFECFVSRNFVFKDFLDQTELALIKAGNFDLPFIDSPEKVTDEEIYQAFNID